MIEVNVHVLLSEKDLERISQSLNIPVEEIPKKVGEWKGTFPFVPRKSDFLFHNEEMYEVSHAMLLDGKSEIYVVCNFALETSVDQFLLEKGLIKNTTQQQE